MGPVSGSVGLQWVLLGPQLRQEQPQWRWRDRFKAADRIEREGEAYRIEMMS